MKKVILLCILIAILGGCAKSTSPKITKQVETSGIHEISYDELKKKLSSKDVFILYIGRPDCGDCKEFYPILEEYINNHQGTSVYYLNVKAFRDASRAPEATPEEKDFFENIQKELEYQWTPTLKYIENGKIIDSYSYLDEEYYKIKDKNKKTKEKQSFIDTFITWMDVKFK